jgi:hypothetical protein
MRQKFGAAGGPSEVADACRRLDELSPAEVVRLLDGALDTR